RYLPNHLSLWRGGPDRSDRGGGCGGRTYEGVTALVFPEAAGAWSRPGRRPSVHVSGGICGFLTAEPLRLDAAVGASKEGAHGMRARWRRTSRAGQRAAAVSWDHFFALFRSALRMAEAPAAPRIPPRMRMKNPPGRCRARPERPDGDNS